MPRALGSHAAVADPAMPGGIAIHVAGARLCAASRSEVEDALHP